MRTVGRGMKVFDHGVVEGRLRTLRGPDDVLALMDSGAAGTVALVHEAGATFLAPLYHELAAIICTNGTPRSHIGIMCREFQLPGVMATVFDGDIPDDGATVQVDCGSDAGDGFVRA